MRTLRKAPKRAKKQLSPLGDRLRWSMARAGIDKATLAKRARMSTRAIEHYLYGKRSGQRRGKAYLQRIAKVLGQPVDWLATGENQPDGYRAGSANLYTQHDKWHRTEADVAAGRKGRAPHTLLDVASDDDRTLLQKTLSCELSPEWVGVIIDGLRFLVAASKDDVQRAVRSQLADPIRDTFLNAFGGQVGLLRVIHDRKAARFRAMQAAMERPDVSHVVFDSTPPA